MNGPDLSWPEVSWEVGVPAGAELGERPFWDAGRACPMWVDINAGRLHADRPAAGNEIVLDLAGVALGATAPRRGGGHVTAEPLAGHVLRARPAARGHPVLAFGG